MQIEVFPRVHLTLVAMCLSGYRRNGGLGFAISDPRAFVQGTADAEMRVDDRRQRGFTSDESSRLHCRLQSVYQSLSLDTPVRIVIDGAMPTHYGFGSTTAIRLACLELLLAINGVEVTRRELIQHSGRGGTSGVGIETYFRGGFVLDLGRPSSSAPLRPSSQGEHDSALPLTLVTSPMPQWQVGICIPLDIPALTERQECEFFERATPLTTRQVETILHHGVSGVAAAILEDDRTTFEHAVDRLQGCAWKKQELDAHGNRLLDYVEILRMAGARAVAMSSLGPGLIFLAEDVVDVLDSTADDLRNCYTAHCRPRNTGRTVTDDGRT